LTGQQRPNPFVGFTDCDEVYRPRTPATFAPTRNTLVGLKHKRTRGCLFRNTDSARCDTTT
jgi:hypothetical protein